MNWNFVLVVAVLLANTTPVFASICTAKIKSGKSPYPLNKALKTNEDIPFWSYAIGTLGSYPQYGVVKSFIGDRLMTIPVRDLYDISPGCAKLKEYKENY